MEDHGGVVRRRHWELRQAIVPDREQWRGHGGVGEVPYLKERLGIPSEAATTWWRLWDCMENDDGERGPDEEREEGKPRRVPSASHSGAAHRSKGDGHGLSGDGETTFTAVVALLRDG